MKASFDATGDVIAITGGASGIGRALALACLQAGARVVVCDVNEAALASLRAEAPSIATRRLDVSDRTAVMACFNEIAQTIGPVDSLVCAAATQPRTNIHEMDPAEWQRVIAINLNGVMWCYQAVITSMIARRKGSIVAFSSGLAHQGWPKASAYAATKGALIAWAKSAAKEVAEHRVRVNLIAPGVIDTPQYRAANAGADDASWKASTGVGGAQDVIGPLMFLLSDAATMTASLVSRDMAYPRDED
ncbi:MULTISPECIES: SDR family oxidoreductase [unclassified Beijerinckia]|uniref:SDR family NAD(P)-dependent oxidoreductase n=1 Tax=unclassified Beijerinckia TaxID=2638183 RepID=UPI0008982970|nr:MULTISPECIES: SDR family oxidoreductase [unclassified Beijerinckia]MDH7799523.1 2-hydroxycyclohexanecarboxyl-CoA dehydrogenase [Beijerinckia sp. GAS462]SEB45852.1 NADP-dependent 3-hydroxy acid dehydrogenase YdfG [Beijerinckia sp. 28-YEA-48]